MDQDYNNRMNVLYPSGKRLKKMMTFKCNLSWKGEESKLKQSSQYCGQGITIKVIAD